MPSKNRSDKGDKTVKASVNPRKEKSRNPSNLGGFGMVPVVGLEPTRCRQQRILSPPRLPIPTHRQEFSSKITTPEIGGHFGGQTSKIKDIQFSKAQINRAVPASEREMTHWILSPSRLPIPSHRQKALDFRPFSVFWKSEATVEAKSLIFRYSVVKKSLNLGISGSLNGKRRKIF